MRLILSAVFLALPVAAVAQFRPSGACPFTGFQPDPAAEPVLARVSTQAPATTWMACDSPKGCIALPAHPGTPVLVYGTAGDWTCGYGQDRNGAGAAWFRSADLRPVTFSTTPPLSAWLGRWKGGEDSVVLSPGRTPGTLRLAGKAVWHGLNGNDHFGDAAGEAAPAGNRLHFVSEGCTIDLTLAGPYMLAADNEGCGGMNARFQGFWSRTVHRPAARN